MTIYGQINIYSSPWSLIDKNQIPVCSLYYNQNLQDAIALFELHSSDRNLEAHRVAHFSTGTFVQKSTHFSLNSYTLNTDSNSAVSFGVSSGTIMDEDIQWDIPEKLPGNYFIVYRTGVTEWTWQTLSVPYLYNIGNTNNIIQYNVLNTGSYSLLNLGHKKFVNYYLFSTTSIDSNKQLFLIPGQNVYNSQSKADEESINSLNLSNLPLQEFAPLYKLSFEHFNNNNNLGSAVLTKVSRLSGVRSSVAIIGSFSSHNSLSGRTDADSHPASAISYTPSGDLISTNVQDALDEIESVKLNNTDDTINSLTVSTLSGTGNRVVYSNDSGLLVNTASDKNLKKNIKKIDYGLKEILQIEPIEYKWKDKKRGEQTEIGLIAQDIKEIIPEIVGINNDNYLSLDYSKLTVVLINAIKDLNKKIKELEHGRNKH